MKRIFYIFCSQKQKKNYFKKQFSNKPHNFFYKNILYTYFEYKVKEIKNGMRCYFLN